MIENRERTVPLRIFGDFGDSIGTRMMSVLTARCGTRNWYNEINQHVGKGERVMSEKKYHVWAGVPEIHQAVVAVAIDVARIQPAR